MNTNSGNVEQNLNEAIKALSLATAAMERRLDRIDQSIIDLTKKQKKYLMDAAESRIPEISPRVLAVLIAEFPEFVTSTVQESFESNRKFLGLFFGQRYKHALTLLQTRLASYLDQMRFGELRSIDDELQQLASEKKDLSSRSKETLDLLNLLERAQKQDVPLPQEVSAQINTIVATARAGDIPRNSLPNQRVGLRSTSQFSSSSSGSALRSAGNDDIDLWIYLISDIPTSFRTLLFDAISDHRHHSDSASTQGASSDWSNPSMNQGENVPTVTENSSSSTHGDAAFVAGAAVVGAAIATDDSLGLFS